MVTASIPAVKRAIVLGGRGIAWVLLVLGLATLAYCIAAWIGSSIEVNDSWREPDTGITIMVETNGAHTGIVMPIVAGGHDWRDTFPAAGRVRTDGYLPTHIAIGWGERDFFLNTPTWSDLDPATAVRVAVAGGPALMRVSHYVNPQPSPHHRPLRLREAEYRKLVHYFAQALPPTDPSTERPSYTSYERHALLYEAEGRYTLLNTCNTWIGRALRAADVRMGAWTPLAGGVMKWVPNPADSKGESAAALP